MAPKKTNKMPTGEKAKQLSKTATRIKKAAANPDRASGLKPEKITPREAARRAGVVRDRFNRQTNTAVFSTTTPTVYSPKPMSAAAKKKAAAQGKKTESKTLLRTLKPIKSESRSKAGSSTVSKVVKRAKTVAREAGDVKKAIKNVAVSAKSALNLDRTGNQYLGKQAVKATGKDLGKQLKELGSAVKSGKPGKRAGTVSYNSDTGTPQGLKSRRAPKTNFRPDYSSEYGGPYKTGKKKK